MTNYRWTICAMLFFATTVNYLDRQVLSLTWDEFIKPEFHWNEVHYGTITSVFSIVYAICMLFAGRFVDWMGTKKGFLWAIGVWSAGACLHAVCGIVTEAQVGLHSAAELAGATGDVVVRYKICNHRNNHCYNQYVLFPCSTMRTRIGRSRKLPRSHQSYG